MCAADSFCCSNQWDYFCLSGPSGAWALCPELSCPKCAHDMCKTGAALNPAVCDPCVAKICQVDPFCCNTSGGTWDGVCVQEVKTVCNLPICGG